MPPSMVTAIAKGLERARFAKRYRGGEDAFEDDVWDRLWRWCRRRWPEQDTAEILLTSHKGRKGRSQAAWEEFYHRQGLADVQTLRSKNRLDIFVRPQRNGPPIGIEVEYISQRAFHKKRAAGAFVHGLGQAVLGTMKCTATILIVHCGAAGQADRAELRKLDRGVLGGSRIRLVVVPS